MNDERYTQKMISEAAGVTEVTIRNRYKSLKGDLKLDI
jgi:transcription initiation factor TFIIB